MARPKIPPQMKRNMTIKVPVRSDEHDAFVEAAAAADRPLGTWLRELGRAALEEAPKRPKRRSSAA